MAASLTASPKLYRLTSPPDKRGLAGCDRHHRHRQASARVGVMKDKIEGPPSPDKRFRVKRDMAGSLASFDTLYEAIADVLRRRGGWRYVILDFQRIVWPENRTHG
jgi:hypothetical protein